MIETLPDPWAITLGLFGKLVTGCFKAAAPRRKCLEVSIQDHKVLWPFRRHSELLRTPYKYSVHGSPP